LTFNNNNDFKTTYPNINKLWTSWRHTEHTRKSVVVLISSAVNNTKIVQCMIFRWNPWTTNWIMCV